MAIKRFDLSKVYKPRKAVTKRNRDYSNPPVKRHGRTSVDVDGQTGVGRIARSDFTFSVVIPAYNAAKYIIQAMDSALNQNTEEPLEIIVVDDSSTDGTYELVEDYIRKHPSNTFRGISLLRNTKNSGVAYSRNQGVSHARGDYIAFLDADDWWDKDKLALQYDHLRRYCDRITAVAERAQLSGKKTNPKYPVLSCTARMLTDDSGKSLNKIIHVPETITYEMLLKTNHIPCSSVLIKSQVIKDIPMTRDDIHEDYLEWLRITKKFGPAVGLDKPLLFSRMSPGGKSRNKIKSAQMQYRCYRHMRISPVRSFFYMISYMFEGVMKYR